MSNYFWKVKTFRSQEAYDSWLRWHSLDRWEIREICVHNAPFAVQYRKLRKNITYHE